jgi:signal peptidase I
MTVGKRKRLSAWRRWTTIVGSSLLLALSIRCFLLESFRMPSDQMANTILAGDRIWVDKTAYGIKMPMITPKIPSATYLLKSVQRHDIVVYRTVAGIMISRCLGLPGDTLETKAHDYFINGEMLLQSPQIILPYQYPLSSDPKVTAAMNHLRIPIRDAFDENGKKVRFFTKYEHYLLTDALDGLVFERYEKDFKDYKVCIPESSYWMLSDNVGASADSRHFGLINQTDIIGKVWLVWFSKDPSENVWHGYRFNRFFRKVSR